MATANDKSIFHYGISFLASTCAQSTSNIRRFSLLCLADIISLEEVPATVALLEGRFRNLLRTLALVVGPRQRKPHGLIRV